MEELLQREAWSRTGRLRSPAFAKDRWVRSALAPSLAGLMGLLMAGTATTASAALGQAVRSVETDRAHLSARLKTRDLGAYTAHTLTMANGGVISEFVNANGTVFAVSWRGPARPDLRQILGEHFATFQADTARNTQPRRKAPPRVERPDLVVRVSGHPGAFWGDALIPGAVPAGFSAAQVQ